MKEILGLRIEIETDDFENVFSENKYFIDSIILFTEKAKTIYVRIKEIIRTEQTTLDTCNNKLYKEEKRQNHNNL